MSESRSRLRGYTMAIAAYALLVDHSAAAPLDAIGAARSAAKPLDPKPLNMVDLGGLLVPMLVVIALLLGVAWLLPRVQRSSLFGRRRGQHLQVIETIPLGGKRCLYLARVHDRALVIGADDGKLATLSEITDAQFVAQLAPFHAELRRGLATDDRGTP